MLLLCYAEYRNGYLGIAGHSFQLARRLVPVFPVGFEQLGRYILSDFQRFRGRPPLGYQAGQFRAGRQVAPPQAVPQFAPSAALP